MKALIRQGIEFFDTEVNAGEAIVRLSQEIIFIQEAMSEKLGIFINRASLLIGSFVIATLKGWQLALVLMSCIPFIALSAFIMSLMVSKMSARAQLQFAKAGSLAEETVGSIRTVVSFSGESRAFEKYNKTIKNAYKSVVHQGAATGLGNGVFLMIIFFTYALAFWYGSVLVLNKGYNGGDVINVILAILTGSSSLSDLFPCVSTFVAGQVAAHKMFEIIHRKPVIDVYEISGTVLEDMKGDIELRNVYFSYPGRPENIIFDGFSLQVPSGSTMALVGESGSGKSTIINLVERFYDPQAGEVLIDGFNLKKLRLSWIREKIGLVSQEPILFSSTIKDNIAYGKHDASDDEIRKAVELAHGAKFISKMPNGIDTLVGEHGIQLSGGQKQRIAIARVILKNPKILLLDEATSALDAESENLIHGALLNIIVDKTTIIIAHRLSTVKKADTISVMQGGRIVAQGSHSELVENPSGTYSQLLRLQGLTKTDEEESLSSTISDIPTRSTDDYVVFDSEDCGPFRPSLLLESIPVEHLKRNESKKAEHSEDAYIKKMKQVPISRLINLNKSEIAILLAGSIGAAVNGAIFPVFGILLSNSIKTYYEPPHQLRSDSRFLILLVSLLAVAGFIFVPLQYYFFGVSGGRLVQRICSLLFQRMLHQEIGWFDEPANSSGAIGARLSSDVTSLQYLVGGTISLMVQNSSTVISGLTLAFVSNWKLAFILLASLPLIGLQGYSSMKVFNGYGVQAKRLYIEATQMASDSVSCIRTIVSFCAEEKVVDAYHNKCKLSMRHGIHKGIISGLVYGFTVLVLHCAYALCFYIGAHLVQDGTATYVQFFKVFFALRMTAIVISNTSALAPDTAKAREAAASVFAILDRNSMIDASIENGIILSNIRGEIEFQHVSFNYPSRPQVRIFTDLSFRMTSGETVAFVGESGSGKSTVISLIERFYDPNSGIILLDGVEIQKLKLSWLRQQMGLVSQEPVLFNGSIRSNIAFGKQGDASEDEIIAVAEAANAHNFISSLPNGYDTNVGERGLQLSGGQKQRIAIARAMIRNPKILLLDEATSALDAESEHTVQDALDRATLGRTTICIAHRLSTIQFADSILVLKNGVIVENGKHETLMRISGGAYASLVSLHTAQ